MAGSRCLGLGWLGGGHWWICEALWGGWESERIEDEISGTYPFVTSIIVSVAQSSRLVVLPSLRWQGWYTLDC
jgi:hypothetical protein